MTATPDFDRIARAYRWMEYASLGTLLERTREEHLKRLGGCRQALVLGDGDGRFTARMMRMWPELQVHAVDASGAMLHLLRRTAGAAASRLQTTQGDALDFNCEDPVDVVVTHFFLDCLTQTEVERLVRQTVAAMRPGALWVVSEFRVPEGWMRWPALAYVRGLYFGFRVLTGLRVTRLPEWAGALEAAGMERVDARLRLGGVLTAELWRRIGRPAGGGVR